MVFPSFLNVPDLLDLLPGSDLLHLPLAQEHPAGDVAGIHRTASGGNIADTEDIAGSQSMMAEDG